MNVNLLAYIRAFAQDLKTGAIYKKGLNPQEQILHRVVGTLLEKALNSSAGIEVAQDLLSEALAANQEIAALRKMLHDKDNPPQEQAVEEKIEEAETVEPTVEEPEQAAT